MKTPPSNPRPKRKRTPAQIKGDSLEDAVRILESAILSLSPGYSESTFHIVPKKIICVDGVHHELDIWIGVEIALGYAATFIFECRNWKKKTEKDDVIVFIDKVVAAQAQTGFFVAKSFTSGAIAKAKTDRRIQLLRVSEVDFSSVPTALQYFHLIEQAEAHVEVNVNIKCERETGESLPLDLETAVFVLSGQACEMRQYIKEWSDNLLKATTNRFPSALKPQGSYTLPFEDVRSYPDNNTLLNGEVVENIKASGTVEVRIWRGELESRFEVENRGRVFRSIVKTSFGEITMTAHQLTIPPPQP